MDKWAELKSWAENAVRILGEHIDEEPNMVEKERKIIRKKEIENFLYIMNKIEETNPESEG